MPDQPAYAPSSKRRLDTHKPGEFVAGLGWSCLDCDSFGCDSANAEAQRVGACSRRGCGRPKVDHEMGFCP